MLELRKTFDATNQLRLVYSIVTKEVGSGRDGVVVVIVCFNY